MRKVRYRGLVAARLVVPALLSGAALAACGGTAEPVSSAQAPGAAPSLDAPSDTRGELLIEMTWTARVTGGGEFRDLTTYDRRTRLVCPVTSGSPSSISSITGPTPQQVKAMEKGDPSAFSAGPQLQPWFNEGCKVRMSVADTRKLDDPTIAGEEPTVHTGGTQEFETRDTLVTVETDLDAGNTRLLFVTPTAAGFRSEGSNGQPESRVSANALPVATVIAGPYPGALADGRHELKTEGGVATIAWKFRRP